MMITRMSLDRRTFLRGLGATVALPFLDAMVPALTAATAPVQRLGFFYVPNGMHMSSFVPEADGANFELSPTLGPLAPFKNKVVVVTGTANKSVEGGSSTSPHTRAAGVWLNGVAPKRTEGVDIRAGITIDQAAAQHLGKDTQLMSLELALEPSYVVGNCAGGYSCVYLNTTSWRTPTTPLPMETNPRAAFERLFGDGATGVVRAMQLRRNASILDAVKEEFVGLQRVLGPTDRLIVTEYLDAVRDVESRIQIAERQAESSPVDIDQPHGIPSTFEEHIRLMFDLQVLAFRGDVTRVTSLQYGREQSERTFPKIGVDAGHHDLSHMGSPERVALNAKINAYHIETFTYLLEKLQATPDGDGSLLDHSMLMYGSGFGDGSMHSYRNLPVFVAGGGCGQLKGGRHIRAIDQPFMNVGVSLLQKAGLEINSIGDSTGTITGL